MILQHIAGMDVATHADFVELKQELDEHRVRLEQVETALAELPAKYASAGELNRVTSSQAEYELRSRQLTQQVADLANIIADSQRTVRNIETRLDELSTMKSLLTTFMETQRERLDNQQVTINEVKETSAALSRKVAFVDTRQQDAEQRYNTNFKPVHDVIVGSETQKSLLSVVDGIQSSVTAQGQQVTEIASYFKAQKEKEAARLNFRQRVQLQLLTPQGILVMVLVLLMFIFLVNALDIQQFNDRLSALGATVQSFRKD